MRTVVLMSLVSFLVARRRRRALYSGFRRDREWCARGRRADSSGRARDGDEPELVAHAVEGGDGAPRGGGPRGRRGAPFPRRCAPMTPQTGPTMPARGAVGRAPVGQVLEEAAVAGAPARARRCTAVPCQRTAAACTTGTPARRQASARRKRLAKLSVASITASASARRCRAPIEGSARPRGARRVELRGAARASALRPLRASCGPRRRR